MANLPFISSSVNITKIEVWVTNKTGTVENNRNILAFLDLGESFDDMYNTTLFSDNAISLIPIMITNPLPTNAL